MSDIELLREAARLMRERATAATPSPWSPAPNRSVEAPSGFRGRVVASVGAYESGWPSTADAEHIAAWHPAVALAIADWLDASARREELHRERSAHYAYADPCEGDEVYGALIVARAFLGEQS